MKKMFLFLALILVLTTGVNFAQPVAGDYRSNTATATWSTLANWDYYDGTNWSTPPGSLPTSTSNVFIQSGHTVSLTTTGAVCKDLNMCNNTTSSTTSTVRGTIQLSTFTLDVNGSLRSYWGVAATGTTALPAPTYFGTVTNQPFFSATGEIRFVGNTRNITNSGEWASTSNSVASTNANVEFALTPGETGTLLTNCKFGNFTFTSGIINILTVAPDRGTTPANPFGNVTISSGSRVIASGSGNTFQRTGSGLGGTLTVVGTLEFTNSSPIIAMTTCTFNGTVVYSLAGIQTLAIAASSGASPFTYTNLTLSGSGAKTLGGNTSVSGTLSMQGTASLALGGFTLTYGGSSTLEYAGSASQTSTDVEFPGSGSVPPSLKINNSNGVILHATRTISGTLTLASGTLTLGANSLTVT